MIVAFAVGLLLSALNVRYRDVNQAITLLVSLWLFLSPVAYPGECRSGGLAAAVRRQPDERGHRRVPLVLTRRTGAGTVALISAVVTVILLATALIYFQKTERRFADVI